MTEYTPMEAPPAVREYAVPVPGRGMVWTDEFLSRYGHVLERARGPKVAPVVEEDEEVWKARALANLRAAALRGRERAERELNRPGNRRVQDWSAPMTGEALRDRRAKAGLSQRDLSKKAGVSRAALSEIEAPRANRGRVLPVTWERLLAALAEAEERSL